MDKLRTMGAVLSIAFSFAFVSTAAAQDEPEAHYFAVIDTSPINRLPQEFIIKLTDPERIRQAQSIVRGVEPNVFRVGGEIVAGRANYNDLWTFHLNPDSVYFFYRQREACDAPPTEVEVHLGEVGGSYLPDGNWCPWTSRVIREVKI